MSVGEKQRINLARVFLKDAPILLMDEPTSALRRRGARPRSWHVSLFALMRGHDADGRHRLHRTIRRVDKILASGERVLTEMGAPDDLLAAQGYYARAVGGQLDL